MLSCGTMEQLEPNGKRIVADAMQAFHTDDAARLREIFVRHPELRRMVNEPVASFDSPPIIRVRSREMLDVLLEAGADINGRSRWWAGGFGILDCASPDVAAYAIERGANVDVHAAARLGLIDALHRMLAQDPGLVHARGGDGQTPLHVAQTVEIAAALLGAGADINALDVDHESTPAQYMTGDRLDVARHLVACGCRTDLLLAVALGDIPLSRQHLDANPGVIRMRVNADWFPMQDPKAGGTIYQWTLGFHASAHQIAHDRGHRDLLQLLSERSPMSLRLLEACWIGDGEAVQTYRSAASPDASAFTPDEHVLVAHAARNNRTDAVRLMLECGLPVDAKGQHRATPLHWAAFHGNVEMVRAILRFAPPLEATDADFAGTPLGWAIHGSEHGWHSQTGDYAATVTLLLQAGARRPAAPGGSPAVRAALHVPL
jgi:ankyrin repeat protein